MLSSSIRHRRGGDDLAADDIQVPPQLRQSREPGIGREHDLLGAQARPARVRRTQVRPGQDIEYRTALMDDHAARQRQLAQAECQLRRLHRPGLRLDDADIGGGGAGALLDLARR